MNEKRKNKIKIVVCTIVLILVVAVAVITACILHAKQQELDKWKEKNDQIPFVETVQIFEKNGQNH